uniref:Uncharacterized protein n=1 Tax=Photinus pyralis TaxID=7054 RepID=A0A1Y1MVD4_PHOPY
MMAAEKLQTRPKELREKSKRLGYKSVVRVSSKFPTTYTVPDGYHYQKDKPRACLVPTPPPRNLSYNLSNRRSKVNVLLEYQLLSSDKLDSNGIAAHSTTKL